MPVKWIVNIGHDRLVFERKQDAMAVVMAVGFAEGTATDYHEKEINIVDEGDGFPKVEAWHGEWLTKAEYENEDTTDENVKLKQLQKQVEEAESKASTAEYYKGNEKKKADERELEVCRLAAVLEANNLDKDGKAIEPEHDDGSEPADEPQPEPEDEGI